MPSNPFAGLLRSRKFWLAVFAVVEVLVLNYFDVPKEIWEAITGLIMVLIATIAVEDFAAKWNGSHPSQK